MSEYREYNARVCLNNKTVQDIEGDDLDVTAVSTLDDVADFIETHGGIHGYYFFSLTQNDIEALQRGDGVMLDIGGEYTGLLKLKK